MEVCARLFRRYQSIAEIRCTGKITSGLPINYDALLRDPKIPGFPAIHLS